MATQRSRIMVRSLIQLALVRPPTGRIEDCVIGAPFVYPGLS
jgi:hypothetical protein